MASDLARQNSGVIQAGPWRGRWHPLPPEEADGCHAGCKGGCDPGGSIPHSAGCESERLAGEDEPTANTTLFCDALKHSLAGRSAQKTMQGALFPNADRGRRPPVDFAKDGIEPPKAAKTGTHRNVSLGRSVWSSNRLAR